MVNERRTSESESLRGLFHEQWELISDLISQYFVRQKNAQRQNAPEMEIVETVVDATNSRMRLVGDYKKRLRSSVRILLDHVDKLVATIPAPIDASPDRFGSDPQLNTYFVSKKHIAETFGNSPDLRLFFNSSENSHVLQAYTILLMTRQQKTFFGMALVGDSVQGDVRQTSVSFTNHRVKAPCPSAEEAKQSLKKLLFDSFVAYVKRYMIQLQHEEVPVDSIINLKNPDTYLRKLSSLLESAEELLQLNTMDIRVNRMGILLTEESTEAANEVNLHEIKLGQESSDVVILAVYPRDKMP